MMPSPPIDDRSDNCQSRWLAAGNAQACADPPDGPAVAKQIRSCNVESAHSQRYPQPSFLVAPSAQPLRQNLLNPDTAAKSP